MRLSTVMLASLETRLIAAVRHGLSKVFRSGCAVGQSVRWRCVDEYMSDEVDEQRVHAARGFPFKRGQWMLAIALPSGTQGSIDPLGA